MNNFIFIIDMTYFNLSTYKSSAVNNCNFLQVCYEGYGIRKRQLLKMFQLYLIIFYMWKQTQVLTSPESQTSK